MNSEFELYLFISTGSVDLEAILQDKRRLTPMNDDFLNSYEIGTPCKIGKKFRHAEIAYMLPG